jgi:hypothetical protein
MKIPLDLINGVRIASPCQAAWGEMAGDDRVRYCSLCSQNVYDLSAMTAAEVALFLGTHDEDVCIRLYRRADGTVMTRDCPRGARRLVRAVAAWVAVAAVSILGFFILRGWGNSTTGTTKSLLRLQSQPAVEEREMGKRCAP